MHRFSKHAIACCSARGQNIAFSTAAGIARPGTTNLACVCTFVSQVSLPQVVVRATVILHPSICPTIFTHHKVPYPPGHSGHGIGKVRSIFCAFATGSGRSLTFGRAFAQAVFRGSNNFEDGGSDVAGCRLGDMTKEGCLSTDFNQGTDMQPES